MKPSEKPLPSKGMVRDDRLEALSEKIRKGECVSLPEAIEAIDYQEAWKKERSAERPLLVKWVLNLFKIRTQL